MSIKLHGRHTSDEALVGLQDLPDKRVQVLAGGYAADVQPARQHQGVRSQVDDNGRQLVDGHLKLTLLASRALPQNKGVPLVVVQFRGRNKMWRTLSHTVVEFDV